MAGGVFVVILRRTRQNTKERQEWNSERLRYCLYIAYLPHPAICMAGGGICYHSPQDSAEYKGAPGMGFRAPHILPICLN